MTLFRNVVFLAALAGLCAGLVMSVLQVKTAVPLILEAETYENVAAETNDHAAGDVAAHEHDEDAWGPEDGLERNAYTALANVVTGIGFALLLVVTSEVAGGISTLRQGVQWGLAGFAVFTLAPGLGLPPELPAMPAADLVARQIWWIGTVAATGVGLWLVAFGRTAWLPVLGIALVVLPHIIGAPQPESHDSAVPSLLHHEFVVTVTVTNLVFWVVLGVAVALLRQRVLKSTSAPRASLA